MQNYSGGSGRQLARRLFRDQLSPGSVLAEAATQGRPGSSLSGKGFVSVELKLLVLALK